MPRFVLHSHQLPRPHFDLRLEHGGTLVSWAVPKGVPETEGVNRLAVAVPDHDLDHLTYVDDTPAPNGAPVKSIADTGTYTAHDFDDDKVVFTLHGRRLTGTYALIRTGGRNWLLRRVKPRPTAP
jgi:DNA ligase D-like protein (predicted 3'-phosphoesterase)